MPYPQEPHGARWGITVGPPEPVRPVTTEDAAPMPEPSESGRWSLHDREHQSLKDAHRREHETEEKARDLAARNIELRLAGLNELREEVTKDRAQFVRRDVHDTEIKVLDRRINDVEKMLDRAEGAVNTWRFIAGLIGVGGIGAVVWAIINMPS